jgi:hypothetical protein
MATAVCVPLQTNTLANVLICFSDSAWTNYSSRFYRVQFPLPYITGAFRYIQKSTLDGSDCGPLE